MSIEDQDLPPRVLHQREVRSFRRDFHESEWDLDAGSEEAEEAMWWESIALLRAERPWEFADSGPSRDWRGVKSCGADESAEWREGGAA